MAKKKVHDRLRAVFHESLNHSLNNQLRKAQISQVARYFFFAPLFLQLGKLFFCCLPVPGLRIGSSQTWLLKFAMSRFEYPGVKPQDGAGGNSDSRPT